MIEINYGKDLFWKYTATRLLDGRVAKRVKMLMSFGHFFNHQIVGSKSNFPSKENGRI